MQYTKISRRKAAKLCAEGNTNVIVCPSKKHPSDWSIKCWTLYSEFEEIVKIYQRFHCNSETGKTPTFYLKEV